MWWPSRRRGLLLTAEVVLVRFLTLVAAVVAAIALVLTAGVGVSSAATAIEYGLSAH
jgi:hypothetical protein